MAETKKVLKIYNFSHPLLTTEVNSVLGDKYVHSLPFPWEFVSDYEQSDVVIWDGVITPRNQGVAKKILDDVKSTKQLLIMGASYTLFQGHSAVKLADLTDVKFVEIGGWSILPEEILEAFEVCYQKLSHV